MAERPIFVSSDDGNELVKAYEISLTWFPGFAVSQKQRSIRSLHENAENQLGPLSILEISSKSLQKLGIELSAFNLMIKTVKLGQEFSVESAFQASKVFESGGPYTDLLRKSSREAKRDPRLRDSGKLRKFVFFGYEWALEPKTAFYDWLYINALVKHSELASALLSFSAFTDIEFNPERSLNCQARSAALFVSLSKRGLLENALASQQSFLEIVEGFGTSSFAQNAQSHPSSDRLFI